MRNVLIVRTCYDAGRGRLALGGLGGGELSPSYFVYVCCSGMELRCRDERLVTDVLTSHGVAEKVLYVQLSSVKFDCSCFF